MRVDGSGYPLTAVGTDVNRPGTEPIQNKTPLRIARSRLRRLMSALADQPRPRAGLVVLVEDDTSNDLVVYDLMTPREFDGADAVHTDFQNGFSAFKNAKVEFINLHVFSDGKMGVAESVQHMTATDNSGKPIDMIFRVTDVWRKGKGGWKIIHSHISLPVDMASGKADMQSK